MKSICLILALHFMALQGSAQMGGADVRFIPDSSFFVMQFDMQKLFTYEKMGSKNLETVSKFFKKQAAIDVMSIKTLTFQFCQPDDPTKIDDDFFGLIMTFTRPINQKEFVEKNHADAQEAEVNGQKYFRAPQTYGPSVCFPDDKTLVMAVAPTLEKMIGKTSNQTQIKALLNSADPNAEVKAAFHANDTYLNLLAEISSEIPFKPFDIEKVFGQAKSAVISGNVKSSTPIFIEVNCKTGEGAETLAKKTKTLLDLGTASIPIGRESMQAQKKEMEGRELRTFEKFQLKNIEMSLKGLDVGEKLLAAAETSHQGKKAFLKVKMMGGVKSLMPMISEMIGNSFSALDELESEFEAERALEDFDRIELEID